MIPFPTLLAAAAFLPLVFALAELCARAWLERRGRWYVWSPHSRTLQILDRDAMPGLPPLARFEVNGDGERGDDLPEEKEGTYRVLVLGGSSTECRFIDQSSTWPAAAQRFLNQPENLELLSARHAHVGNLGRSLTTCRQIDLVLERVLPRYHGLDAVVLMVGASDVVRWLSLAAPNRIDDELLDPGEVFDEDPEGPFGWTLGRLALRRIVSSWTRSLLHPLERRTGAGAGVGRARKMRAEAEEVIDALPDASPMLERFDRDLRELIHRAQAEVRTVIVVRPCWARGGLGESTPEHGWMFAAGDLRTGEVRAWYSQRVADRLLEMVERRASAIVRDMGAAELDPKPLLQSDLEHFYDVGHLSPAGCEIVGRAIAQAVLRERKGRFVSRLRSVTEERHADVA
jgi:hypothetical protein